MSHGHAPFVILGITLDRQKVTTSNTVIGAAFHAHAARISGTVTTRIPCTGFSTAIVSALVICSKVTSPRRWAPSRVGGSSSATLYTGNRRYGQRWPGPRTYHGRRMVAFSPA